ncbi:hypothetical protein [Aliivibrio fischeri]|uniref:hypothetical protein n=1 Tax=Aliivibrio fischeri TaxID=668 RepID=UPI0007C55A68|nr:hypothetical protein [Aliivibrio fischeri]
MYLIISVLILSSVCLFKSRLIQLILLFMIYPIIILGAINDSGITYRIINSVGEYYYSQYFEVAFFYQALFYVTLIIPLFFLRNSKFNGLRVPVNNSMRYIFFISLLIIYPIAYPAIFGFGDDRFGSGGSLVLILNALLIFSRREKIELIDFLVISLNLFALISGERADTILILLVYYVLKSDGKNIYERDISYLSLILILFSILLIGLFSGINRMGGEFTIDYLLYYILNQGTVVDVLHVYLSAFWYVEKFGFNYEPIINLMSSFIPFFSLGGASSSYNVTEILRDMIINVGGGVFYTAGYVSFGVLGGMFISFFYGYFLRILFCGGGVLHILFVAIFLQQLRLQWYGLNYMGNVVSVGLVIFMSIYFLRYLSRIK